MRTATIFFTFFLLLTSAQLCVGQVSPSEEFDQWGRWIYREKTEPVFIDHLDESTSLELRNRWKKINNELARDGNKGKFGIYAIPGETHVSYLAVSEKNGFVRLGISTCESRVRTVAYGDVNVIGDKIILYPTSQPALSMDHGGGATGKMPMEMVQAKWRGVDYLVEEDEVAQFCDGIYGGDLAESDPYNFETSFFSKGKESGSAFDLPILPANYQHLIKKPLAGKVTLVGKRIVQKAVVEEPLEGEENVVSYESITNLTINLGSDHGIKEGMSLYVLVPNKCCLWDKIEITKASKNSSIGIVRRNVDVNPKAINKSRDTELYRPFQIGQTVTSSAHAWSDYMSSLPDEN